MSNGTRERRANLRDQRTAFRTMDRMANEGAACLYAMARAAKAGDEPRAFGEIAGLLTVAIKCIIATYAIFHPEKQPLVEDEIVLAHGKGTSVVPAGVKVRL